MKHKKKCEEVAIEVFAGVVQRTPVETGNLRASWRMNAEEVDNSVSSGGTIESPLSPPQIPKEIDGLKDFPIIYVTNSKPYAELVENGGPDNPPAHMVKHTIESLGG